MNLRQNKDNSNGFPAAPTRMVVTTLGIMLGISGMIHGFFEVLQGNKPTESIFIEAIGEEHRWWDYGGEAAITLIPNFLLTGLLVMFIGVCVIIWSLFFIHKKYGSSVFLILNILSFLTGGGIFQVIPFTMTWIFSTRIGGPFTWWKQKLPADLRQNIKDYWLPLDILGIILYLIVQFISIFGFVPGISNPDLLLGIIFLGLFFALSSYILAFICGIAYELESP